MKTSNHFSTISVIFLSLYKTTFNARAMLWQRLSRVAFQNKGRENLYHASNRRYVQLELQNYQTFSSNPSQVSWLLLLCLA